MLKGSKHKPEALIKIGLAKKGNKYLLGFKFSEESKKKMRESHLGQKPWNRGIPMTEEQKKKQTGWKHSLESRKRMSLSHMGKRPPEHVIEKFRLRVTGKNNVNYGKPMNPVIKAKLLKVNKGSKHSLEHRKKQSESNKGSKASNWKGGITPLNHLIRHSLEYKIWREEVFKRDNWTCVFCGIRSSKGVKVILHADHIKSFADFPELRFDVNNGRTLCLPCHKTTDTYAGKYRKLKQLAINTT